MFKQLVLLVGALVLVLPLLANALEDVSETVPEPNVPETVSSTTIPTETEVDLVQTESIPAKTTGKKIKLFKRIELFDTNPNVEVEVEEEITSTEPVEEEPAKWNGPVLTARLGVVQGPSGKETYYNLPMQGVINIMRRLGYEYEYWVRDDGVKMFGPYVMCAANLDLRPRGTILETSLGTAIVCDTGTFALTNQTQIDIAVDW